MNGFPPVGAIVNVARGIGETEKDLARFPGREYVVDRYTKPHGYAVIYGRDGIGWHVHPEALERVS